MFERDALLARARAQFRVPAVGDAVLSGGTRIAAPPALGAVVMSHCSGLRTLLILPLALGSLIALSLTGRSSAEVTVNTPPRWIGARVEDRRIRLTVADTGQTPRTVFAESDRHRREPATITDLAFDAQREVMYLATCCEPGSGQLQRIDLRASPGALTFADQGFAVDVAGETSVIARTDTFGTLAIRTSPDDRQEVRAGTSASDVAVAAGPSPRVFALIQPARLRAVMPTVAQRPPAILMLHLSNGGRWAESRYPLSPDTTYCRIISLADGAIGLLAGEVDRNDPITCAGDRLDVYDLETRKLRIGAVTFPKGVRHLSTDDSSTFLIATTVEGAVRWQTLAGAAGVLAPHGFMAADW